MAKSFKYLIAFCCVLIFHHLSFAHQNTLAVTLELSKQKYLKSEPIFASISITNTMDVVINIPKLLLVYNYFEIIVQDATGRVYPFAYERNMNPQFSIDSLKLQPHETISQIIDLLPIYANGKRQLRDNHTKTYFEPGSYTVQVFYESNHTKFQSEIISFVVEEPIGIEREVYDLFVQATNLELKQHKSQASIVLDTLIQKYPKSSYNILAYMQRFQMYEWSDKEKEQEAGYRSAISLIEAHPESDAADLALTHILVRACKVVKTPKERKELLVKLGRKYPETKIGKRAKKALESSYRSIE